MNCPKCKASMERVTHSEVEIDRCTDCRGIWFDLLERERLMSIADSDSVDIGDPDVGAQWNQVERIDCPVCFTRTIPMVDVEQPHIWFEACKSCGGIFLDAGEFKDLKERTLLDRLKALFVSQRP